MDTLLLITLVGLNLVLLGIVYALFRRTSAQDVSSTLSTRLGSLELSISQQLTSATADMASRLEGTKGDLRQQVTDRLAKGFQEIRDSVDGQLANGRREQTQHHLEARKELTGSLALTTSQLKAEFEGLNQRTAASLDSIRDRVDARLQDITHDVQEKLDQNIKEGFAQFEKVQQHLRRSEERRVGKECRSG